MELTKKYLIKQDGLYIIVVDNTVSFSSIITKGTLFNDEESANNTAKELVKGNYEIVRLTGKEYFNLMSM